MSKYEELKETQPSSTEDSKIVDKVYKTNGYELDKLFQDKEDLILQLNPQTCTWGIDIWENMCGIEHSSNPLGMRRIKVITQLSQVTPITKTRMKNILKQYGEDSDIIEHFSEYYFEAILITSSELNLDLKYVDDIIERIKPCHLDYLLGLKYPKVVKIKTNMIKYMYDFPICGTIYCGEYPYPVTSAQSCSLTTKIKPSSETINCDYEIPICGTIPYTHTTAESNNINVKVAPTETSVNNDYKVASTDTYTEEG